METTELLRDLFQDGYRVYIAYDEAKYYTDTEIAEYMRENDLILLHNDSLARGWYFTSLNSLTKYFNDGNRLKIKEAFKILA